MWENHSAEYWKDKLKKKEAFQRKVFYSLAGLVSALLLIYVIFHRGSPSGSNGGSYKGNAVATVPRPQKTKAHEDKCIKKFAKLKSSEQDLRVSFVCLYRVSQQHCQQQQATTTATTTTTTTMPICFLLKRRRCRCL